MALTPLQIIEARAPQLVGDTSLSVLLELADPLILASVYGAKRSYGLALLVLHWKVMDARGGAAGGLTGESEGQLSRQYAQPAAQFGMSDLHTTSYGMELLRLQRGLIITPMNRMVDEPAVDCGG